MVLNIFPDEKPIDFSFIPSFECNLNCSFCMYDCGPLKMDELDLDKTVTFIQTIDWDLINSVGYYGGEISINMGLYQRFIDIVPENINQWCISNGTWSKYSDFMYEFIGFLKKNKLFLVVSGTPEHKKHQDEGILNIIEKNYPDAIRLKGDDEIHPMGRAKIPEWSCSNKCQGYTNPTRLGLFPNGDILFQNCDGSYPLIQTYEESFEGIIDRVKKVTKKCSCQKVHTGQYKED